MQPLKQKSLHLLFFPLSLAFFANACVGYLYQVGKGQAEILWKRRPISEVLSDPRVPQKTKDKLRLVEEVREFARKKIGLKVEDTYQQISMLDRDSLAWNVTASRPLEFRPKLYYFPFVGKVPYLGFFDKKDALAHAKKLESEGWETLLSEVGAYSTLGWFDDPLISTQLNFSDRSLAALVIHECAHATLWFSDDVTFNESFASFVGRQGSREFFENKWGQKDSRLVRWDQKDRLRARLYGIYRKTASKLDKLYKSHLPKDQKRQKKAAIIKEMMLLIQKRFGKHLRQGWLEEQTFNNAFFLSFRRYKSGQGYFQKELEKCQKDWACFLKKMHNLKGLSQKQRKHLLKSVPK